MIGTSYEGTLPLAAATTGVAGLEVVPFDLPDGCVGGYYPELNPLVPLWLHDERSKTPAYKSVPVRIRP